MKKPIIAIDIDDVLADSAKGFVQWSNQRWGTNLKPEDYDEHWAKLWQISDEEVEKCAVDLHETGALRNYGHIPSAKDILERLGRRFKLIIITSRRTQVKVDTLDWINKYYPGLFDISDVNFAGMWDKIDNTSIHKTKADIATELGADYLIDDQLKHCISAAEAGVKTLLFGNYTWNQSDNLPKDVIRVKDWAEVEKYFDDRV